MQVNIFVLWFNAYLQASMCCNITDEFSTCPEEVHFNSSYFGATRVPNLDQVPPTFSMWMTDIPFLKRSHLYLWIFGTEPWISIEKSGRLLQQIMEPFERTIFINEDKTYFFKW